LPPDPLGPFLAKFKDKTLLGALGTYCGWSNHQASEFANLVIGEGVANSFDHARGSFSLVAMRIDTKNVTLAIADDGRGIPEVLRSSPRVRDDLLQASDVDLIKHFTTEKMILDSFVIDASTRSGVSSKDDRPGVGLFYLKNTVLGDGGELRIRSGRAEVTFADDRVQAKHDDRPLSPGTSLRIVIPRRVRSGG
jgi:glucose-6-phosphate-specific signal transduction histidine kinase